MLHLVSGKFAALMIKDHAPCAGCTLIDRRHEVRHGFSQPHPRQTVHSSVTSRCDNCRLQNAVTDRAQRAGDGQATAGAPRAPANRLLALARGTLAL